MVKSRNPSDAAHAASSESAYSAVAGITNTAPSINIVSASQSLSGNYVTINYTGTDAQNDTNNLTAFEYSTNGLTWQAMTEKAGVGSSGTSGLIFSSTGTAYVFAWDVATDLPNQEQATVYVRLVSTDTLTASSVAGSSAFYIDTRGPIISGLTIAQTPNSDIVTFEYNLADFSGADNTVTLEISDDSGLTYAVPITTLTGDIGSGITAGTSRSVTWDAGIDFANQESSVMKIRIRGTDRYGNLGDYAVSGNFSVDTKTPVVSAVTASQNSGSGDVTINYVLADNTSAGHLVEFFISDDGGATWNVATTTRNGDIGLGQTTGVKTFNWSADVDFNNQESSVMRVRVRAKDYFGNQGDYASSANFSLDTKAPIISAITASQTASTDSVAIGYNLNEAATTVLDISSDGGLTWTVTKTSLTGDLGAVTAGNNKAVTWNAGTDFGNQENSTMRVRLRGSDSFDNTSIYYESTDFTVDTAAPLGLVALTKFTSTATSATLTWAANTDAHFNHYELWHGTSQSDIENRTGSAIKWSTVDDANLNNPLTISTVISGIDLSDNYFVKIWAIDDFGNEITVPIINLYEAPAPVVETTPTVSAGGGLLPALVDNIPPQKPILNPLVTPTQKTSFSIAGLAEPRSKVELYDNGVLIGSLNSLTDSDGTFAQNFNFIPGVHSLTVKAIDSANNASQFSDQVVLNIVTSAPTAPIVLTPQNNISLTDTTPQIVGVSDPNNQILIRIDNNQFTVTSDSNGAWNFILPSTFALADGTHAVSVVAVDAANNQSPQTTLTINKTTVPVQTLPTAPTGGEVVSLPANALINETTQAVELPGIPVPKVSAAGASISTTGDILSFTGTSLPNSDVVIYIHSDQALIYQTRTDALGNWKINHSQTVSELAPGQHTIYAVTLDTNAKVKSRPSAVSSFMVKRNLWVMIFKYLNWQTTLATLIVLLLAIFWLYRIRKVAVVQKI
ncbi:MAG: Ig-like domain-containing protein [Candidatus Buchananbacteria bacterium]